MGLNHRDGVQSAASYRWMTREWLGVAGAGIAPAQPLSKGGGLLLADPATKRRHREDSPEPSLLGGRLAAADVKEQPGGTGGARTRNLPLKRRLLYR